MLRSSHAKKNKNWKNKDENIVKFLHLLSMIIIKCTAGLATDKWINEWTNKYINEQINKYINEQINK